MTSLAPQATAQNSGNENPEHRGEDLAATAQRTLEAAGERWTKMRAIVFATLADISKPASAYDIADAVSQRRGKRVAPNSVYRILDLFVETNLARRVESANGYIANSHPDSVHDCIFMICDKCGNVVHIDDDAVAAKLRDAAGNAGFADVRPVIELRGRCSDCS
ncbi:MAG: Fur family transcriptional regulator [Pseudomonadota bacterium]